MGLSNRLIDFRGCAVSGATPAALDAFEHALAAFQGWHSGSEDYLAPALRDAAPSFVMAHVLQAYLYLSSRDPVRARPRVRCSRERANYLPTRVRDFTCGDRCRSRGRLRTRQGVAR